ncbi:MAG: hypothetical protein HYS73_00970, partial [Parcubacteria group bacterium]|nr:hypothetical protein [Parcubacteria group bacterium]
MNIPKNTGLKKKAMPLYPLAFILIAVSAFLFSPVRVRADVFNENDYVRNAYGVEFQNETDANYPAYTLDYIKTGNGGLKLRTGNVYGPAGNNSSPFNVARLGIGKDPTAELDVLGTIAGNILQLFSSPSGLGQIQFNGTNFQWRSGATGAW